MKINWDKKITLTANELYALVHSGLQAKPGNRIKSASSFKTGVFAMYRKIVSSDKWLDLIKE